jgi:CRP/FNR family cyclic AMP-dependent transcriptional regulator
MLSEINPEDRFLGERRSFDATIDDIAQWAGLSLEKAKETINHMVAQRRLGIEKGKIIVNNIHDLSRMVSSRRKGSA